MLKKEILMDFKKGIVFVCAVSLLLACGNAREKNNEIVEEVKPEVTAATTKKSGGIIKEPKKIDFVFYKLIPHCGGAAPNPDMEYPMKTALEPSKWVMYVLDEAGNRQRIVGKLESNEYGAMNYAVQPGTYQLFRASKLLPFQEFMKAEKPKYDEFHMFSPDRCFKEWQERADFEFEVKSDSSYVFSYDAKCFVGIHPCMYYDGPTPP
jgi:hypothetical protein